MLPVPTITLWDIAERFYGSGLAYPRIYRANRNRLSSPHVVRPCLALEVAGRASDVGHVRHPDGCGIAAAFRHRLVEVARRAANVAPQTARPIDQSISSSSKATDPMNAPITTRVSRRT